MKIDEDKAWDRIAQLLTNSERNVGFPFSNCFGSVLYVLGDYDSDKPYFAEDNEMRRFLEGCVERKDYLGPVVFFRPDDLIEHAGIYIGRNIMFHQQDIGMRYEFKCISDYLSETPDGCFLNVEFYASLVR